MANPLMKQFQDGAVDARMLGKLPITDIPEPVKLKEKLPDTVNPWSVLLKGAPNIVSEELVRFPKAHVPK